MPVRQFQEDQTKYVTSKKEGVLERLRGDDKLRCSKCGHDFWFTEKDRALNRERGWTASPRHCIECRTATRPYNTLQDTTTHLAAHSSTHNLDTRLVSSVAQFSSAEEGAKRGPASQRNTLQHTATHCNALQHILSLHVLWHDPQ